MVKGKGVGEAGREVDRETGREEEDSERYSCAYACACACAWLCVCVYVVKWHTDRRRSRQIRNQALRQTNSKRENATEILHKDTVRTMEPTSIFQW